MTHDTPTTPDLTPTGVWPEIDRVLPLLDEPRHMDDLRGWQDRYLRVLSREAYRRDIHTARTGAPDATGPEGGR